MRDWIVEADLQEIVITLELQGLEASKFTEIATAARSLLQEPPATIGHAVELLSAAKLVLGDAKTGEKANTSVAGDLSSSLKTLPGDALFLNQVSPRHTFGFVAYLRRVIEVGESSVVRTSSRLPHDARYLRVSRLRSPYIYALSQQFASVFSAIGLPGEYEAARDSVIERLKNMED